MDVKLWIFCYIVESVQKGCADQLKSLSIHPHLPSAHSVLCELMRSDFSGQTLRLNPETQSHIYPSVCLDMRAFTPI